MSTPDARCRLSITGVVQGVGFRPFVARLARRLGLAGSVRNAAGQVLVEIEGPPVRLDTFAAALRTEAPGPARIDRVVVEPLPVRGDTGFVIAASDAAPAGMPTLLPDTVTCPACLAELRDPANRRHGYVFISCAECGPRHSVVTRLPFDRAGTTLVDFPLCAACAAEYADPADRRFHAQTIGCPACGPRLTLTGPDGLARAEGEVALAGALALLRAGGILALKGVGGYQLLVDARDQAAVARLRRRKQRPAKPLALMVRDQAAAAGLVHLDAAGAALLADAAGPIVLADAQTGTAVAPAVACGLPRLGLMLPSSGLHARLLDAFDAPLVVTSGNLAEAPIAIDEEEALAALGSMADAFLQHNRRIAARLDDSVAQVVAGRPQLLRRARGYVPLALPFDGPAGWLAMGAHQKNAVAIALGEVAVLGPHQGDLDTLAARAQHRATADALAALHAGPLAGVVVDAHPDYASTRAGLALAAEHGVPTTAVLHHVAHVHAAIAEHRLPLPVLGVAWDGTGLGAARAAWGGEAFVLGAGGVQHVGRFSPFPLPGGERAAESPPRALLGALWARLGESALLHPAVGALIPAEERALLGTLLRRGLNTPVTSSVGRLFDALAALTGLAGESRFEGEAAMRLQAAAEAAWPQPAWPLHPDAPAFDTAALWQGALADLAAGASAHQLAARFHATLVAMLCRLAATHRPPAMVLCGGCFQNRLLLASAVEALQREGHAVFWPQQVPPNDGGLALGQLGALRFGHGVAFGMSPEV